MHLFTVPCFLTCIIYPDHIQTLFFRSHLKIYVYNGVLTFWDESIRSCIPPGTFKNVMSGPSIRPYFLISDTSSTTSAWLASGIQLSVLRLCAEYIKSIGTCIASLCLRKSCCAIFIARIHPVLTFGDRRCFQSVL